jgi:hypothetical protein
MTEPTTLIQGPMEGRSVLYQVSLAAHAGTSAILTPKAVASIYEEIHAKFAAIDETIRHGQEANLSALEGLKSARDGLGNRPAGPKCSCGTISRISLLAK